MADPVIPAPAQPPHPVLANGTFGLMSGEKPMHQAGVDATHENLTTELRRLGLHFEETHGRYEQPERSVIVHAPTRDQMFALGKRFGQDSVVYSRGGQHELLYTNGPHEGKSRLVAPGAPAIEHFGEAPPDYYTHLPGRGYFRINFDWDRDPQHQGPAPAGLAKAEVLTPRPAAHPHGYPWHEGHTDHHQQVRSLAAIHAAFGLAKADDLYYQQNAAAGVSSYARFAGPYGQVLGQQNPSSLRFYPYENKGSEIDDLVRRSGYRVYYAGGAYGKPDLAAKNYNTGHLMIYDPGSAGSFDDRRYTDSWRKIHELAHALTYPELNSIYGEGRRIGKLGTHRTPNEAGRAVHWEWLAAHKQRELGQQIGVHVPDEVFHRELNTVMHDAVHRAVTGQFTEPGAEGFVPHPHKVPLAHALDAVRDEAQRMGIQHPHGLAPKKGMAKAWPRNEQENIDPRAAANVAFDNMLERGNAPIPYQPTYTGPAGVHEHTETSGLLDYDPASDNYVRGTGPGKPAAHVAGGPYVTEGDSVRAVLDPNDYPASPTGQRTVAAMREAARANAARLRPPQMNPLSFRPTTPGELHGKPPVSMEDQVGLRAVEGQTPAQLENAYWRDVDQGAPTTAAMKWKKYGGKHPIDAIREQKEAREAKLKGLLGKSEESMEKNLPGQGLKSPAAAGVAPQLHNDLRSFHAALKQHAPGSPGHQALLAAHASHTPLLQDLGKYGAAGSKIITAMNSAANAKANAGPQAGMKVTAKSEAPVILTQQGNLMPPVETMYTPAEAAEFLKKAVREKITAFEVQLQDLRKRELSKSAGKLPDGSGFMTGTVDTKKALVPPHKHNTGSTVSAGVEDVAAAKLNPPGKDDPWKKTAKQDLLEGEPLEDTPGEETSGERSPADVLDDAMTKEELCKECGSLHKAGMCKAVQKNAQMGYGAGAGAGTTAPPPPPPPAAGSPGPMMRAELTDPKGKTVTTGEQPSATMPDDGSKHVNEPAGRGKKVGSGGVIRAGKSLKSIKKAALQMSKAGATPPMAKPPSGANMGTKVPASKPGGMGKEEMAGSPAASSGGTLSGADGAPGGLGKASMTSQMMGGGASKLTSPADTSRADSHAAALGGAFQPKGPVSSGLELDRPKAGGLKSPAAAGVAPKKLGVMGKDEKSPFANKPGVGAPGTSKVPAMGGSVPSGVQITQPIPTRKPAAGGMHSVGSATPSDALTAPDTQVSGTAMFGPHGTPALPGVGGGRRPENTVSLTAPSKKPGIFGRLGKSMKSAKK